MAGLAALLRKTIPALTVLADGTAVHAAPNFDAASIAMAHELGYNGDVLAMTRDHDPLHRILSQTLGLVESPALRDAANNATTDLGLAEEDVILALQRYVNLCREKGLAVTLGKRASLTLLKFNPDQARDERGRWGDGATADYAKHFADNLGIKRGDMPQIPNGAMKDKFLAELADRGVGHSRETVMAHELKATQSTFNAENISYLRGVAAGKYTGNPIVISREGRVLDGHHRWVGAAIEHQPIDVVRVDLPAHELVAAARDFSARNNIPARKFWALLDLAKGFNPDQPRDANGRWGDGSGGHDVKHEAEVNSRMVAASDVSSFINSRTIAGVQTLTEKYAAALGAGDRQTLNSEQQAQAAEQLKGALANAHADKPGYDKAMVEIAHGLGARPLLASVKGGDRLLEKHVFENGSDASRMKDLVRGSIVVDKIADVPAAIAAVREKFGEANVLRTVDRFASPTSSGYRDVLMNVKLPSGLPAEVQIHVPEMLAAKGLAHSVYEIERSLPKDHRDIPALQRVQQKIYGQALKANNRKVKKP